MCVSSFKFCLTGSLLSLDLFKNFLGQIRFLTRSVTSIRFSLSEDFTIFRLRSWKVLIKSVTEFTEAKLLRHFHYKMRGVRKYGTLFETLTVQNFEIFVAVAQKQFSFRSFLCQTKPARPRKIYYHANQAVKTKCKCWREGGVSTFDTSFFMSWKKKKREKTEQNLRVIWKKVFNRKKQNESEKLHTKTCHTFFGWV